MSLSYIIKEMTEQEFMPLYHQHKNSVFENDHTFVLWDILSKEELADIKKLGLNMGSPYKLYLAAFDANENFVGWTWGFQENSTTFYMCNSAVLENHRRKGLYSMLLNKCTEILKDKGFQLIYSRHCATNNAVIIPKLKAGFVISKMELEDKFGVLIHLHLYTNKLRHKIMDYRSGQLSPDEELKKIFKIKV